MENSQTYFQSSFNKPEPTDQKVAQQKGNIKFQEDRDQRSSNVSTKKEYIQDGNSNMIKVENENFQRKSMKNQNQEWVPKFCGICCMLMEEIVRFRICQHTFCYKCLLVYINFKIKTDQEFICPQKQCNQRIDQRLLKFQKINDETRMQYLEIKFKIKIINKPNSKFCPNPNCTDQVINKKLEGQNAYCSNCKTQYCFKCLSQSHKNRQCYSSFVPLRNVCYKVNQIRKNLTKKDSNKNHEIKETTNNLLIQSKDKGQILKKETDYKTEDLNQQKILKKQKSGNSIQCPYCKRMVEKNQDNNHMKCACKYQFCYVCREKRLKDHHICKGPDQCNLKKYTLKIFIYIPVWLIATIFLCIWWLTTGIILFIAALGCMFIAAFRGAGDQIVLLLIIILFPYAFYLGVKVLQQFQCTDVYIDWCFTSKWQIYSFYTQHYICS